MTASRVAGVREVDPVVGAEDRRVHGVLRVREREPGQHHVPHVRPAVVVGVFEVEQVGRGRHEDALLPAHDAGRQHEAVGEDTAAVVASVAVGVVEQPDAAGRAGVERIAGHLDDEHAAVLVDVDGHGARHVGLGGDRLDDVAGLELHRGHRLGRRERRTVRGAAARDHGHHRREEDHENRTSGHLPSIGHPPSRLKAGR